MLPGLLLAGLSGCASVHPDGAFESTREMLAGRHPGEAVWLRDAEARTLADARVRVVLAAPLTPDRAAEIALLRNPGLQATFEELGIGQADLAQATRLSNPGLSFARLSGDGASQRTVTVTGDVVDWLVRPLRKRLAAAELERTKLTVGRAVLDVVASARLTLVRHQAAVQLADRLAHVEEIDRAAADYARALFDAGNLTALERANAEAGWYETRAASARAQLETVRSREEVVRALGLSDAEAWTAGFELEPALDEALDAEALQESAVANRLDLSAADWAVSALERALALKKKTRFLPVGVEVGAQRERDTDGLRVTGPVVELRLPLFDTGKASVARLGAELERARWQRVALEGQIRSEVREKVADLDAARQLCAMYRETIVPLRREVLARTLREYNQMLIGTFDLLRAKEQVVDAERGLIDSLAMYWEARIAVDRATGGGLPLMEGER
jgi:cobalt-zinc-cadmium efflux system outer membrane protein